MITQGPTGGRPEPAGLAPLVAKLVARSRLSQRELTARSGLSKDQLSRTLLGKRPVKFDEAITLLKAADLPARGALTLALFDRADLAIDWSETGLSAFLETLIQALPEALVGELGEDLERVNPRWGPHAARFVAQRIAHHIQELIEREEKLGEFEPRNRISPA
jgi:transcriptional regulator with XRE-family HTH domain